MHRLILITLVLLSGCQQELPFSASALTDADIAQIQAEITELSSAINEHFAKDDGAIDFYEPFISIDGFRDVANGQVNWTYQEYLDMIRKYKEGRDKRESVIEVLRSEIQVLSATSALSIEEIKQTMAGNDGKEVYEMATTTVWVKVGDEWKILNTHQSNKI